MNGQDVALRQYQIVASYLQYENTMYWQRAQLFLLANAALLGFVSTKVPLVSPTAAWELVVAVLSMALGGLALSVLWWLGLRAGEFWVLHWHGILRQIEPAAFPNHQLFRHFEADPGHPPHVRARRVARGAVYLFFVLWALLVSDSLIALGCKLCQAA